MKQIFVKDLAPDSPVRTTFLVQSKERKITSNGGAYLDLNLQDTTGVISAKLWDYSERTTPAFEADDIVLVEGHVELYRGTPQLRVRKITTLPAEEVDLLDYLPRTQRNPEEMYALLLDRVRGMSEGPLRTLLLSILEDPCLAEKYKAGARGDELSPRLPGRTAGTCVVARGAGRRRGGPLSLAPARSYRRGPRAP